MKKIIIGVALIPSLLMSMDQPNDTGTPTSETSQPEPTIIQAAQQSVDISELTAQLKEAERKITDAHEKITKLETSKKKLKSKTTHVDTSMQTLQKQLTSLGQSHVMVRNALLTVCTAIAAWAAKKIYCWWCPDDVECTLNQPYFSENSNDKDQSNGAPATHEELAEPQLSAPVEEAQG